MTDRGLRSVWARAQAPARRRLLAPAVLVAAGILLGAPAIAQDREATIVRLNLDGVVDPFTANHVVGGLETAADQNAAAVLLLIDTPGGLDSSMRQITKAILNSEIPVICYVSPEGARAASAGAFILLSCHVAAMAPATNVGAASPVGISGAIASRKAMEDAAGYIRGIAEERGRNVEWAESAVRDAASVSASEALELGVIDLVEPDIGSLLGAVDGRTVVLSGGRTETIDLEGARIVEREMGLVARLLHALLDPNIAFILFYLGVIALYFELANPGLGIPAIVGVVLLVAAFLSFGVLPVELAGVLLLIASAIFFAIEVFSPGIGVPLAGGIVCLILGGMFLFDTSVPRVSVSPLVIAPVAVATAAFFGLVVRAVVKAQREPPFAEPSFLLGEEAVVVRGLDPEGVVRAAGEEWSATTEADHLPVGSHVRITRVEGLHLTVSPTEPTNHPSAPANATRTDTEGR